MADLYYAMQASALWYDLEHEASTEEIEFIVSLL